MPDNEFTQAFDEAWAPFREAAAPDDGAWPHADEHNAREAGWARTQTAQAVFDRLDAAHAQARTALAGLAPEEVADERFRAYFFSEKTAHYEQHLRELEPRG